MDKVWIYPVKIKAGHYEYALWDHYKLCPTARYVGGTSYYLCECVIPERCPGVKAAIEEIESKGYRVAKPRVGVRR